MVYEDKEIPVLLKINYWINSWCIRALSSGEFKNFKLIMKRLDLGFKICILYRQEFLNGTEKILKQADF